jgi:hypothetical protein
LRDDESRHTRMPSTYLRIFVRRLHDKDEIQNDPDEEHDDDTSCTAITSSKAKI